MFDELIAAAVDKILFVKDYCEKQYSVMLAEQKDSKRIVKREAELAAAYTRVPDLLRSIDKMLYQQHRQIIDALNISVNA